MAEDGLDSLGQHKRFSTHLQPSDALNTARWSVYVTCHMSRDTCHVCRWGAPGLRQARSEEVLCPPGQVEQEAANPWHEAEHSTGLTYTLKVGSWTRWSLISLTVHTL